VSNDNEPPSYQEATAGESSILLVTDVQTLALFYSHTSPLLLLSPGYAEMEAQFAWDDKTIRRTFIRKVYAILMVQLFVTVVLLYLFCLPIRSFSNKISSLLRFPWNTILLVLFVSITHFYNTKSVVLCLGITALVCLSVTIFSFQSKIDVTSCQGVLFSLCMVMLLCAITISIVPWLHATYAVIGAILFTLFLAFDTQLLLGNKRYTISPEEYIFATLSLYLDIIYLFSFLLQIMGEGRE
uniref:Protein lifeguard 2 n=1 Tax=Amphilophus citrinellus TaxID=61819 RepID=A0A3Q0SZ59_AMPCI